MKLLMPRCLRMYGYKYYWFGLGREMVLPGHETDLKSVREDYISITPLHLDLTHHYTRSDLTDKATKKLYGIVCY